MNNYLLIGIDFEGDVRESWYSTLEVAKEVGYQCLDNSDGFGWLEFSIYSFIGKPIDNPVFIAKRTS